MDMNPQLSKNEERLISKLMQLNKKHIFTKNLGDGEINRIVRSNDRSTCYVYFHSNSDGPLKVEGEEFLTEIKLVRDLEMTR